MAVAGGLALTLAAASALAFTPLVRRLAEAAGWVDTPAAERDCPRPVPHLGGLALAVAVGSGVVLTPVVTPRALVVGLGAALIFLTGLADDRRGLPAGLRLLAQVVAAGLAVQAGLVAQVTGVAAVDVALTLLWVVGLANAANLMDNMDGAAAGVVGAGAAGSLALAALGEQRLLVILAGALTGACAGFLAHNLRPAAIFMGDAGSLLLGYLLAVVTLDLVPAVAPPVSFGVPVLLAGVLILDTTVVTVARPCHGRPVASGATDHLTHRLVVAGLPPGAAVAVLVGAQGVLAALAVAFGRGVLPVGWAAGLAAAVAGLVLVPALRARVYAEPPSPAARRVVGLAAAVVVGLAAAGVWLALNPPLVGQLTVSHTTLSGGEEVAVAGRGFAPGTPVEVQLEDHLLGRVRAGPDGALRARAVVPEEVALGVRTLQAAGAGADGTARRLERKVDVLAVSAPPVPGTWVLAAAGAVTLGGGGLVAARRRRRLPARGAERRAVQVS